MRPLRAALVLLLMMTLAACTTATADPSGPDGTGAPSRSTALSASALAELPQKSVSPAPPMRLAKGLLPPTNRWFSGLVFGDAPQAVFPLPLSFGLTGSGFAFGLPHVSATANTIFGGYTADVSVDAGAGAALISAYDAVSVTIALLDRPGGTALAHLVIAEGSPFVALTAAKALTATVSAPFAGTDGAVPVATANGTRYGVVAPHDAVNGTRLQLAAGQTAQWFAVPTGGSATKMAAAATHPVTGVTSSYALSAHSATTTLTYSKAGGTVVGALPHQKAGLRTRGCGLGSYATIYGTMTLCAGGVLSWSVPRAQPSDSLALSRLSGTQKTAVETQLKADTAANPAIPTDSYGGGKGLYRLANLLQLATQLHDAASASTLRGRLAAQLDAWTQPQGCAERDTRCFVYDPAMHGAVGLQASYGSDQFNDHHFHYGYLLYAAGVLATVDPSSAAKLAPVMNAVAADIASPETTKLVPQRRVFDPYAGHSWASGYSPFADGNNQESSSEAVNAWNGLALWAQATGQSALGQQAQWMLSAEADSARSYQTAPATAAFPGFDHDVLGILWGGKRDFGTWFSADPAAVLGIQLIPMSPASGYLAPDSAAAAGIAEQVDAIAPLDSTGQFSDYLLMYRSLAGGAEARAAYAAAQALPADSSNGGAIDSADSKAYLLAFIASHETG